VVVDRDEPSLGRLPRSAVRGLGNDDATHRTTNSAQNSAQEPGNGIPEAFKVGSSRMEDTPDKKIDDFCLSRFRNTWLIPNSEVREIVLVLVLVVVLENSDISPSHKRNKIIAGKIGSFLGAEAQ
jgi:hypothetical protein